MLSHSRWRASLSTKKSVALFKWLKLPPKETHRTRYLTTTTGEHTPPKEYLCPLTRQRLKSGTSTGGRTTITYCVPSPRTNSSPLTRRVARSIGCQLPSRRRHPPKGSVEYRAAEGRGQCPPSHLGQPSRRRYCLGMACRTLAKTDSSPSAIMRASAFSLVCRALVCCVSCQTSWTSDPVACPRNHHRRPRTWVAPLPQTIP